MRDLVDQAKATSVTEAGWRGGAAGPTARRDRRGDGVRPPVYFDYGYQARIRRKTFITYGAVILDVGHVCIGDEV